jgi:competence protein ComEA
MALAAAMLLTAGAAATETRPVNINTASVAELTALQGIGESKAKAIVDFREKNGNFKSIEDLKLVVGIGDKLFEQLRPQVTLGSNEKGADKSEAKKQ